jgi:hypothetical protein
MGRFEVASDEEGTQEGSKRQMKEQLWSVVYKIAKVVPKTAWRRLCIS